MGASMSAPSAGLAMASPCHKTAAPDDWTLDYELARTARMFDIGHNILTWDAVLKITVVRVSQNPAFTGWSPVHYGTFEVESVTEKDRLVQIMRFVRQGGDDTGAECATPPERGHHAAAVDDAVADAVDEDEGSGGAHENGQM